MAHGAQPFRRPPEGHFSDDGRVFGTPALRLPSGQPTHYVYLTEPSDPNCLTLFFASESLVAICSTHPLLYNPPPAPTTGLIRSARGPDFPSRFMPEYKAHKRPHVGFHRRP